MWSVSYLGSLGQQGMTIGVHYIMFQLYYKIDITGTILTKQFQISEQNFDSFILWKVINEILSKNTEKCEI